MKEASKTKFYLAKYFFLTMGTLQWLVAGLILLRGDLKAVFAALVFFTSGFVFITMQLVVAAKLKRVALGKKKVAVIERSKTKSYKWPDIKSMQLIPFFNLYSMKVKGRKNRIYFLPTQSTPSIYGMFASNELGKSKD